MDTDFPYLRQWLLARQKSQSRQFGVSFQGLDCDGLLSSERYQSTFFSAATRPFRAFNASRQRVRILSQFEGLIRPGEMLLVLGRPGSGCTTFLKTLAGEARGVHVSSDSKVNYQGYSDQQMRKECPGMRLYLAELDAHFAELTLGQTLEFAVCTKGKVEADDACTLASFFELDSAFDTPIGDTIIRGLSGGEKHRASIAEAFVGGMQLQCWDNSTRGLDSETARRFVDLLRESTDVMQSAVVMSLYQASEAMYQRFDKVMVLYEGREIFFGPIDAASDYFTQLGFVRPDRATTPDFLTSLTNPVERIFREGNEGKAPRSPAEFADVWQKSNLANALREDIRNFESIYPLSDSSGLSTNANPNSMRPEKVRNPRSPKSAFQPSIHSEIVACLERAFLRLRNNPAPVISAVFANGILGLIIGSAFYNLSESSNSIRDRSILLFFALMVNSFIPAFEVDLIWAQKPVIEKQHRYGFNHPFAECLASIISSFPAKLALALMLHLPIYFLANLRRTAASFFTYWLFMLVNLLTMSMFFRMIGSLSRSRNGTMIPISILTLFCVIYTGFVVPPPDMVPWFGWFRFINPVAWTYQSLMINEFARRRFYCQTTVPNGPAYMSIHQSLKMCSEVGRVPGTDYVAGSDHLDLKYGYSIHHLWRNLAILFAMMIVFCIVHLLAAEYIPATGSRGEVLFFKSGTALKFQEDEEAAQPANFAQDVTANVNETSTIPIKGSATPLNASRTAGFHWHDITFSIKASEDSRQILKGIDGWLKPGTFTILMGATGAGKTTLLDILSDRVAVGEIGGKVYVDGKPRQFTKNFRRRIGYVQQNDIHLSTSTVREALQFSALLRQDHTIPKADKLAYVEQVLHLLEMEAFADAIVGDPGEGLNVEQRKRLSIAVEMAAKPDLIFFLDEPTSGLDSQTAWSICTLLRKLVDNGHTLICTVHQPSAQLFRMFDRLLLLKDGATIYFGDIDIDASTLTNYFEGLGARKCLPHENPAEWVLSVTGKASDLTSNNAQNWADRWQESRARWDISQELEDFSKSIGSTETDHQGHDEFVSSLRTQVLLLTQRLFRDQWRDPLYLYTKIAICIGINLVNGLSFYMADNNIQGLTNLLFSVFLVTQLFSVLGMLVIPRFVSGRNVFEARERDSKMYSWVAFLTASVIVEITWISVISALAFASWYYPTGMQRNGRAGFGAGERGAMSFLFIWLFCSWTSTLSLVFAAWIQLSETAIQLATLCFWLSLVFCGILVPRTSFPRFWIFMYRVSPLTYLLEGLSIAGVADKDIRCSEIETLQIPLPPESNDTCGQYLDTFVRMAGGTVLNAGNASGKCLFCPMTSANTVLETLGMGTTKMEGWRNVGFGFVFVGFNILAAFIIYRLVRVRTGHV